MKRYTRGIIAIIISLGFMGGTAGAQEACQGATITNTGPGSVNEIICVDSSKVHVTCTNDIYVVNNNTQTGGSGDASNIGNTTGGQAITGNATNENGATVQIGAACVAQEAKANPPAAPVKPKDVTPSQPQPQPTTGLGAVNLPAAQAAVLPDTASNPVVSTAMTGVMTLVAIMAASKLAVFAYQQVALK